MDEKLKLLNDFFEAHTCCAIAFSGGADSTYLLSAAVDAGINVRAYTVKSAFQPAWEQRDAERYADFIGAPLTIIPVDVLCDPAIVRNDAQRCYYCKRRIMEAICAQARADGFPVVLDGTNASDEAGDRPGMRALNEFSILSPLRACGLTKSAIYRLSKEKGLPSADKPAYACLATRIPAGQAVTQPLLTRVEEAEDALFARGFSDFRVRLRGDGARLELSAQDMERFCAHRAEYTALLQHWFSHIDCDPKPRKGN